MWLSISEFDELWDQPGNEKEFDIKYDEYQQWLDLNSKIILDSRMWVFNQPEAFNVFFDIDARVAAERIFNAGRWTDDYASIDEVMEITRKRDEWNEKRYRRLYNVELYDLGNYNLVIDTTKLTPEQVLSVLLDWFNKFCSA